MNPKFIESFCSLMALSVAGPTGLQLLDVVLLNQLRSKYFLGLAGLVSHLGDELTRADVLFRVSVAVEAPAHLQRWVLVCQRHSVHTPVASLATDALLY